MTTNFISRYEKALTRQECRDIIEEIEFFDSNSLLFDQNAEEPYLQDQKAIVLLLEEPNRRAQKHWLDQG